MQIVFLKKFSKDLEKLKNSKDKSAILQLINQAQTCKMISEIPNTKKLVGFKDAYRIRLGNLRIGVFINGNTIEFARIAYRKDIYNLFP